MFRPGWKLSLFVALLLPALLSLGFWQLDRALQKQTVMDRREARRSLPPVALAMLKGSEQPAFRRVRLRGHYLPAQQILRDNQIVDGRFGYEVITPLRQPDGVVVLVSRGWLAASLNRSELPQIPTPEGPQLLTGEVYVPLGEAFTLGDTALAEGWPKRVQWLDVSQFNDLFSGPVFPYVVRLEDGAPSAFTRHWQAVNVLPAKHTGYAVQWFSMAVVLAGLYLAAGFGLMGAHKRRENEVQK